MEVFMKVKLLMNLFMVLESFIKAIMIIIRVNEKIMFLKDKKTKLFIIMVIGILAVERIINK